MTVADQVKIDIMTWQHIVSSSSPWALLCATIACALVVMLLRRKVNDVFIMEELPEKDVLDVDKKPLQHSPFFVYLGHNAITESGPQNAGNTSRHAIHRIPEHVKIRNAVTAPAAEPDFYSPDQPEDCTRREQWRSYSHADTLTGQVSISHIQQMHDGEENGRQWSRRIVQVSGI